MVRDHFDSPELDRTLWNVVVTGAVVNDEQQAYIDSPTTVRCAPGREADPDCEGALVLQPRYSQGYLTAEDGRFDFVSGRIDTRGKLSLRHGTASARIKLPAGPGVWPAFWALGNGSWPEAGEIDIMESVGDPEWVNAALHGPGYAGETPLVNRRYFTGKDATAWRVYAVHCGPDSIVFSVDGEVIYRVLRPMVEHYGRWVFDEPKYLILNVALGGTYPLKTNGIRSPYRGLPASTVERVRRNEIRLLVDWVSVDGE